MLTDLGRTVLYESNEVALNIVRYTIPHLQSLNRRDFGFCDCVRKRWCLNGRIKCNGGNLFLEKIQSEISLVVIFSFIHSPCQLSLWTDRLRIHVSEEKGAIHQNHIFKCMTINRKTQLFLNWIKFS